MNIQDLIKLLGVASQTNAVIEELHRDLGKYVIIRSADSGVHFGVLVEKNGSEVVLECARRCWRWWAAKGISLTAVAIHGLDLSKDEIRIAGTLPHHTVLGVCEIIPCSDACIKSFAEVEDYVR